MSSIPGVVAVNTFREAVRDRVLYNLIFFVLIMIGTAILVGPISIGIERMVIVNLGLSAISLSSASVWSQRKSRSARSTAFWRSPFIAGSSLRENTPVCC
jgi:hypothetical protein